MGVAVLAAPSRPAVRHRSADLAVTAVAAGLAFIARLIPVLRGGGLTGLGNYDDGVYYSAGTALLHGLLPYRDFLFLHPPGIVLALAPFGIAGLAGHDPTGLATARVAWMLLGALNTVLVARILRPIGRLESAIGALFYATAYPAIYIEWTPLLEGPAQTCVLAALLLLQRGERSASPRPGSLLLAGLLLGASATFKIWGVVAIATVLVWLLARRRWRAAARVTVGAVTAVTAVCLPFFLAAPAQMWRMVVVDQVSRGRDPSSLTTRLAGVVGLGLHGPAATTGAAAMIAISAVLAVLTVAAIKVPAARLPVALTATLSVLLLASPSWFLHYPGLPAGPLAVAFAAGAGALIRVPVRATSRCRRWAGWAIGALLVSALVFATAPTARLTLGRPFPAAELNAPVAALRSGCVAADDPTALVELNVLTRNLDRGCPFIVDLGGYSYDFGAARGAWITRSRDPQWQQEYLSYLSSSRLALAFRYPAGEALSEATEATIAGWPTEAGSGDYSLRRPR